MRNRFAAAIVRPRRWSLALLLLGLSQLSGCATALSGDTLRLVARDVSPKAVLDHPQQFVGRVILVTGPILRAENRADGTLLEVLGYPPTSRGFPDTSEPALGRFLLRYPGYLDTLIYQRGRYVAAAGRVVGEQLEQTGAVQHPQPLLQTLELTLLPERPRYYAPFHFGFGLMFGF
ncbi:Slp family lipoprotein [Candidatus Methylocalor cossyra]|uniref:Slp family lipoprotein n=1 Tax=Candidatus Methylocalor cossyra TaxID=3108543 RepID=UPI0032B298C4